MFYKKWCSAPWLTESEQNMAELQSYDQNMQLSCWGQQRDLWGASSAWFIIKKEHTCCNTEVCCCITFTDPQIMPRVLKVALADKNSREIVMINWLVEAPQPQAYSLLLQFPWSCESLWAKEGCFEQHKLGWMQLWWWDGEGVFTLADPFCVMLLAILACGGSFVHLSTTHLWLGDY